MRQDHRGTFSVNSQYGFDRAWPSNVFTAMSSLRARPHQQHVETTGKLKLNIVETKVEKNV